jgi:hypothetical protein
VLQAKHASALTDVGVPKAEAPCMDVVDALDGFCKLERRSATLDGSVLLRAAQGCKPFLDGNAAGFQVRLSRRALLRVKNGRPRILFTDSARAKLVSDYTDRVDGLVAAGLLPERGYWHRELKRGAVRQRNGALALWTGLLVRPAAGIWIFQSRAFNRRSRVPVREAVIPDDTAFVPLILELEPELAHDAEIWLTSELACLVPLWPDVEFTTSPIEDEPAVGAAFNRFYDEDYDRRRANKPTGDYRRLASEQEQAAGSEQAKCRLVVAGGPNIHRVRTFTRFVTEDGITKNHPQRHQLEFVVVRNMTEVVGVYDGRGVEGLEANAQRAAARFRTRWKSLYGPDALSSVDLLTRYAVGSVPPRREAEFSVFPWVFVQTPPGWSSLSDGSLHGNLEGLRGILSTDAYFYISSTFQCVESGPISIPSGAEIERVVPVPRQLLEAPIRMIAVDHAR